MASKDPPKITIRNIVGDPRDDRRRTIDFVNTFNGETGDVVGVNSVNGSTGAVEVVGSFNGSTGAVEGVNYFNGSTGTVAFTVNGNTMAGFTGSTGSTQSAGTTFNLEVVSTFNGATGDVIGVSSVNGKTGAVTLVDLVGVATFNGLSGDVEGVGSFNGATGAVEGVGSFNGLTGAVEGVSSFAGFTGDVASGVTTNHILYHNGSAITGDSNFYYDGLDCVLADREAHFDGGLVGPIQKKIKADEALAALDPVYITGSVGASDRVTVAKADASDPAKMPAAGVVKESFTTNEQGYMTIGGSIFQQDTSDFTANETLYVAAGGGVTAARPTGAGNLIQNIARAGRIHAQTGTVLVTGANRTNDVPNALIVYDYIQMPDGYTADTLVGSWNGLTGDVDVSASQTTIGGVTLGNGGATFSNAIRSASGVSDLNSLKTGALLINDNYNFPTGAGATGDILMIANDGDLEFESLKMSTSFVVDSDIPLATGIRYKAFYAVPMQKMAVTNIELRSDDVSPAGSGDSLQVALKTIRRNTDLEAASPSIQTTVETVAIALGGEYHTNIGEASVDNPNVGAGNNAAYLVVDVVSNAGNHTNFCMTVTMEARP